MNRLDVRHFLKHATGHATGHAGMTLVEAMIVASIMAVIALGFSTMMVNQMRETQAVTEKLASQDVGRSILNAITNSGTCSSLMQPTNLVNPSQATVNLTGVSATSPVRIPLHRVPLPGLTESVVVAGAIASPLSRSLSLNPESHPDTPGVVLSVTGQATANLEINFDQTKLIRPLRNLSFPLQVQTTGGPTIVTLVGCAGAVANRTAGRIVYETPGSFMFTVPSGVSSIRVTVIGGGGGGGGTGPTAPLNPGWPLSGQGWAGVGGLGGTAAVALVSVAEGVSIPVTVGAGGTAGPIGGAAAGNGGTSSFGSLIVAIGGKGARSTVAAGFPHINGPDVADPVNRHVIVDPSVQVIIKTLETQGSAAILPNCGNTLGGGGGRGLYGSGGPTSAAGLPGISGLAWGDGGSGGSSFCGYPPQIGGVGASGAVVIEW